VETLDQAFESKDWDANITVLKTLLDDIRRKTNAAVGIVYEKENSGTFRNLEEKVSTFVSNFQVTIDRLQREFEAEQIIHKGRRQNYSSPQQDANNGVSTATSFRHTANY
jgi:hypothetical protein